MSGYSIGRRIDGFDTDNNSVDFVGLAISSPGEPNLPQAVVYRIGKKVLQWGYIKKELIVGRGVIVYYPFNRIRLVTY